MQVIERKKDVYRDNKKRFLFIGSDGHRVYAHQHVVRTYRWLVDRTSTVGGNMIYFGFRIDAKGYQLKGQLKGRAGNHGYIASANIIDRYPDTYKLVDVQEAGLGVS